MAIPGNVTLITLTGQYLNFQGTAIDGQVKIYPSQVLIDALADTIIIPATITKDLVNGSFSVTVPVTNDPDVSPLNYFYYFEESFTGGSSYIISLPASLGATVDITDCRASATISSYIQPIAYQLWPPLQVRTQVLEGFYSASGSVPAPGTYAYLYLWSDTYATLASTWGTYANAVRTSLSFTTQRLQDILDRMGRLQNYTATQTDLRDTTNLGVVTQSGYRAAMAKYGTYTNWQNEYATYNLMTGSSYTWTYSQIGTLLTQLGLALTGQDPREVSTITDNLLRITRSVQGNDYGALTLTLQTNAQVATNYSSYLDLQNSANSIGFSYPVRDWADRLRTNANRPHALLMKDYSYGINV
jgi:hypothetical protein